MNIVRIQRLLKNGALLVTLVSSSLFLTACGGDSKKSSSTGSSSSSSTSSHTFSSTAVTTPGSGTWPDIKVSANHTKTLTFEWNAASVPSGTTYYKLWKQTDKNSSFIQVGSDFTATTVSDPIGVHLVDWVNSSYKVQACDNNGCTDSKPIAIDSAMLNAVSYFKASVTHKDDWFGWSVAISGDGSTLAVGAPNESSAAIGINGNKNDTSSPTSGAVYVFVKSNGVWVEQAYLKASNTEQPSDGISNSLPNARFGYQLALDATGNTLAVSAINEDSRSMGINCAPNYYTATDISTSSSSSSSSTISLASSSSSTSYQIHRADLNVGAVYVFKRDNNQWSQTAYIKPSAFIWNPEFPSTNQFFGASLTLSGDGKTLAVGVVPESNYFGVVIPFHNSSASSSSSADACYNFSSSSTSNSSSVSSSLSSSSSSSSTSSTSSSIPGGPNSGAVYIYHLDNAGWQQDTFVKAYDGGPNDFFGESLSLSDDGTFLAVGASGEDSNGSVADAIVTVDGVQLSSNYINNELNTGAVYVYQKSDNGWAFQSKVKPTHNEWNQYFGSSVALSGDGSTLAVGTPGDWSNSADPTDYKLTYTKTLVSTGYGYAYTPSPAVDSSYATGAAYVFSRSGASWAQQAYIKASNPKPGYYFGSALSLSRDGNVLAVGSWPESSQATGINGDGQDVSAPSSGAAYAFVRTGTAWAQKSYIKAPNGKANDRFGHALGLDASGEDLIIGAHREGSDATGVNGDQTRNKDKPLDASGAVYLY